MSFICVLLAKFAQHQRAAGVNLCLLRCIKQPNWYVARFRLAAATVNMQHIAALIDHKISGLHTVTSLD